MKEPDPLKQKPRWLLERWLRTPGECERNGFSVEDVRRRVEIIHAKMRRTRENSLIGRVAQAERSERWT